jgi:hypothetical protein
MVFRPNGFLSPPTKKKKKKWMEGEVMGLILYGCVMALDMTLHLSSQGKEGA